MVRINEEHPIRSVLEQSDKKVEISGYQGIVVETTLGDPSFPERSTFEGTLMYFPGVTVKQLGV